MNRIRVVFVILAVVMFIPLGLLVENAVETVQAERSERHRTVAERVFDEMERELTRIVQTEQERKFSHYRFFYVPEADTRGRYAVARSPLSELAEEPYILGHFQIDPDQTLHSPMLPRESSLARAFVDWDYTIEIERSVGRVERVAALGLLGPAALPGRTNLAFVQKPGSTRNVEPAQSGSQRQAEAEAASGVEGPEAVGRSDAFDALRSLNRSTREQQSVAVRLTQRAAGTGVDVRDLGSLQSTAPVYGPQAIPLAALAQTLVDSLDQDVRLDRYFDVDAALREEVPNLYPVAVYPLKGQYVGGDHLLLYREAMLGGQRFIQGVVLDFRGLTEWLDQTVLGGSGLANHAARDFFMRDAQPARRSLTAAYVYVHRFKEPFGDLAIRFMLRPLPDLGGAGYLYTIAALLVVAGSVGLFALYHMVGVTVRYAERRSNFAAAVSHELKTPLTAIRMHGEMLRDGMVPDDTKKKEYYHTITAESERLTRLIDNVLEFSRIEQGARDMSLVTGSIDAVLSDTVRTLEGHVAQGGFELECEIAEGLPPVRFERDAVVQMVYNLVDNALKYAGDAEKKVLVLSCLRAGDAVRLTVRDFGPGVEARHLRKIFDPFYRGENEMTRRAKGTGIGLALVKGLAERMGAAVSGRNLPDGGFEVAVTFRAAVA